ncbi:MAG: ParA family protein [Gemmataceae bacterium]|nr:ParA family protein [Gemmataceae bacterium]
MSRRTRSAGPIRLAIWFGKGGVGKSTTTMMLSLFAARRGHRILTIDLDPECGTSRDFFGERTSEFERQPENISRIAGADASTDFEIRHRGSRHRAVCPGGATVLPALPGKIQQAP